MKFQAARDGFARPSNERKFTVEKHNSLYDELAGRFGNLSQLFSKLSSSKASQELLDNLTSGDTVAFNQLIDSVDIPILGKCFWVREIIERVVVTQPVLSKNAGSVTT
jgi:hypothetical protein